MRVSCSISVYILAVMISSAATATAQTQAVGNDPFLNFREIRISARSMETVDETTVAWGKKLLKDLGVADQNTMEKARNILNYIHKNCAFTPDRPKTIADFLATKKGNCYAHARLGAFLLRLAGIPAKFAYEIHLELKSSTSSIQARERGIGLFGHYHNDHFWLLFFDGNDWQPFDSALGILGYDEFTLHKVLEPSTGVANPPFIVWGDTGGGMTDMENITAYLWQRMKVREIRGVSEPEWQEFLSGFYEFGVEYFNQPLPEEMENRINHIARKFFAVPRMPLKSLDKQLLPYIDWLEREGDYIYLVEQDINQLGYYLLGKDRVDEAIAVFRLNVRYFPESFNTYDSLAEALFKSGDLAGARDSYQRSLELNPDNDNAREMLEKIAAGKEN